MKFPSNKIESAVSQEQSRYTINAVKLDVDKKRLIATDGHIMAVVPCEVSETDHSGLIGTETIKQIRAVAKRHKCSPTVSVNGRIEIRGLIDSEFMVAPTVEGSFPNWEGVVPKIEPRAKDEKLLATLTAVAENLASQIEATSVHEKKVALDDLRTEVMSAMFDAKSAIEKFSKPTVSFDVNLLVRLADALRSEAGKKNGHKRVSLWIKDANSPVVVKSTESSDSESIGVMMPVRA